MNDLISRQAAIYAFGLSEKTRKYGGDHSGYDTRMLYEIQDVLEGLPSAQPEIIRCKDCKHWYSDADTGMACEFTNLSQPEDGFCNWAERKDGEEG